MIETDRLIAPVAKEREDHLDRTVRPKSLADYVGQPAVRQVRRLERPLDLFV